MISIQNLSIHFTGQDLFTDINFLIREKDRIGLVGKNGAGKTTLIRIIAGLEQPSHGGVVMSDDVTIGYLPQEKNIHSTKTVLEETMTAFEEYHQIEKKLAQLQDELSQRTDYESDSYQKLCERMSALNERLTLIGGHSAEGEAEQILVGLGFDHEDMQREMMRLLAKQDRIRHKLGQLNPNKKKDSKKIVAYNEELKDIDAQLKMLQEQSGIKLDELDHGTKLGRFVGKIKRAWKRFTKKVKKVYERNEALIVGIASVVIPIVGGIIIKGILGLFG